MYSIYIMLLIMIHIYLKYIYILIYINIYIYIEYFDIYISYKSASIHSVYLRSNILDPSWHNARASSNAIMRITSQRELASSTVRT